MPHKDDQMVSPIGTLPHELLADVFDLVSSESAGQRLYPNLPLSHVSRRWRTVALATSSLWTEIEISLSSPPSWSLAEEFLVRSHPLPINLCVSSLHEDVCAEIGDAVDTFKRCMDRCVTLSIFFNNTEWVDALTSLFFPVAPSPKLHSLDIRFRHQFLPESEHLEKPLILRDAPALRTLRLDAVMLDLGLASLKAYSSITTLDIGRMTLWSHTAVQEMFHAIPSLEDLRLRSHLLPLGHLIDCPPILIPSLRRLVLDCYRDDPCPLAAHLSLPALEALTISANTSGPITNPRWTIVFGSTPESPRFPKLTSLTLEGLDFQRMRVGVSSACPALKHLVVEGANLLPVTFLLRPPQGSSVVSPRPGSNWPALETVRLGGAVESTVVWWVLSHREAFGKPLSKMYVKSICGGMLGRDQTEWLRGRKELSFGSMS
ncbi:hypothetical protein JAAARDRAFT_51996 [Jaapia argillacea MUCL 33604]|uniref:F-box domain-containing protein n=1 Tax=Jaapia argillacea MUCL 33604 TaxID=933084 RepID=A0A067QAH7_9AGAM|nr:hypothetical protein JAAARDRAFT_51996 [Jaapia argillacea MUCL 33604]